MMNPKRYSRTDLESFTDNFTKKIGKGSYSKVYKGQLLSGEFIAVKKLKRKLVVEDNFMAEVRIIGNTAHRNIVKFYGYCSEDNMKALVYELMDYGSLDKILNEKDHCNIEWVKLYDVATDIARGIQYLHDGSSEKIIHRDIKPANVFLDKNLSAKVGDFGLIKIIKRDVSCFDLSETRGTRGYAAPEVVYNLAQITDKCDVYSYGMMLFDILGQRRNGVKENCIPETVWNQFEIGKLEDLIRDFGIKEKDKEKAIILSKVALRCIHCKPEHRPSMIEVIMMLTENLRVNPSNPFQPEELSNSSMVPSQEGFPQVHLDAPLARSKRKKKDSLERDPACPSTSYAAITGGVNNGPEDDGVILPLPKKPSPNIIEENLATLVPNKGMKMPVPDLVGETAIDYKNKIVQCIEKAEAVTIGVYGMGGAGKTTILKHVYNHLLEKQNCFDKIIWVVVPKDGNTTKLQDDLAKEIDIKLSDGDDNERRSRLLLGALEKRKRFVFFFDDMWTQISLYDIGIPKPTQENGFKLILTTRNLDMCRTMGCHDNTIEIKRLPEAEALELFMNKVGCVLTQEVREIAVMVAKKCAGLPISIITVSKALRGNSDIIKWKVALDDLKDPNNRTMDIEDNDIKCLRFSYEQLKNETQRKCFLCCALYPGGIGTRDLIDFWILDGLVKGRNREDELLKGQYILNELKDCCLLESGDSDLDEYGEMCDKVIMHDQIRKMALSVTKKCFMVKNDPGLEELSNKIEWGKDLERAFFACSGIKEVSISPFCPKLSTLILGQNLLETIPHNFFVNMKNLKILDLRCIHSLVKLLPDSISDLVKLRALRLGGFLELKKLPSLARLVLLRRLELNRTGIEELPEGIEKLVNLRCLNLHEVNLKKKITRGLISRFSLLQELYLGNSEVESGDWFAKELLSLKHLENLCVTFDSLSDYTRYLGSRKFKGLKCFFLAIGKWVNNNDHPLGSPTGATIQLWDPLKDDTAPPFPKNTKGLSIKYIHDVERLNELRWLIKKVEKLEAFSIGNCNKLKCIWSSEDQNQPFSSSSTSWIECLKKVTIEGCIKFYTLFERIPIPFGSFPLFYWKELIIARCQNLKILFPSSRFLQLLPNLEMILIQNCQELEEFVGYDEENRNTETPISFPRLKYLNFDCLPKLEKIWSGVMICDSLESVYVFECTKLKRFPALVDEDQFKPPLALMYIKGTREWWGSLDWDPAYPKHILDPFFVDIFEEEERIFELQCGGGDTLTLEGDMNCQLDGEDSFMLEEEKSSQSDECAPERAGIDREKTFQLDLNVTTGFVCHNCEKHTIVGKRYRCKYCWEKYIFVIAERGIGFDLCEECYNTPSKPSDPVNHHRTQGHTFELIANNGFDTQFIST